MSEGGRLVALSFCPRKKIFSLLRAQYVFSPIFVKQNKNERKMTQEQVKAAKEEVVNIFGGAERIESRFMVKVVTEDKSPFVYFVPVTSGINGKVHFVQIFNYLGSVRVIIRRDQQKEQVSGYIKLDEAKRLIECELTGLIEFKN